MFPTFLDENAPVNVLEQFAKEQISREHGFGYVTYADHCRETFRLDEELKKVTADRDEWRKCNLGIVKLCAETERELAEAKKTIAEQLEELNKYADRVSELALQVCDGSR